ncbi:PREDICTED: cysteine-rich secretory protein 2-like [Elephantulus edwardii]|uniref:cysteine-rich secretory protein 2-like n=1 Tax=Elephantulus edwardii TaxID=28737 RepID=UPI0003F06C32|nr:PREDICTED: cysteine-rich secretory protein 2-like [Elephantulus edwardii]
MTLLSSVLFLVAVLLPSFPANGMVPNFASLSTMLNEIQEEIVNKHNSLRKNVSPTAQNMLKMTWDKNATVNAQKWADMCQYEHSRQELRTTDTTCGENLYMSSDPNSWSDAIQSWYDEVNDFTYGIGAKSLGAVIGHYTQVVWDTSYRVGCGLAHCPNEDLPYFYVCQYCPAGNYENRVSTPYKKGPTCASCPNDCEDGLCTNSCSYYDNYSNCAELKEQVTCEYELVKNYCKATCLCEGKIY